MQYWDTNWSPNWKPILFNHYKYIIQDLLCNRGVWLWWVLLSDVRKIVNETQMKKEVGGGGAQSSTIISVPWEAGIVSVRRWVKGLNSAGCEKRAAGKWRKKFDWSHKVSQRWMICGSWLHGFLWICLFLFITHMTWSDWLFQPDSALADGMDGWMGNWLANWWMDNRSSVWISLFWVDGWWWWMINWWIIRDA